MNHNITNEPIIAYCGLCCTNCGMFIKDKCQGCHSDKPMNSNCKMKACSMERGFSTCALCKDFGDFKQCKKLYNIVSRFFGFIFNTDRIGNLNRIKTIGLDRFKQEQIGPKKL
ncbi:MAG: hypothetical protein CVU90_04320 [Firmicutes bacterium HGW-Firmicutes-15]|nr:MAG: hypothetical protein CVU90_04320 [Firmicutes bacterium HGW-Firmicutes-15]